MIMIRGRWRMEHYLEYIVNDCLEKVDSEWEHQKKRVTKESMITIVNGYSNWLISDVFMAWMMPKRFGQYQGQGLVLGGKGMIGFQNLLSQLIALGAGVSDEECKSQGFLRSNDDLDLEKWIIIGVQDAMTAIKIKIHLMPSSSQVDDCKSEFGDQEAALLAHKLAVKKLES
ncbi:hypothetical protein Tco_0437752 [Tanacetum coccineum]